MVKVSCSFCISAYINFCLSLLIRLASYLDLYKLAVQLDFNLLGTSERIKLGLRLKSSQNFVTSCVFALLFYRCV